jgi:hypothetical protein
MPEAIILEFDGLDTATYRKVNDALGIDPATGEGDWPAGLLSHTGAEAPGGFVVFEIWDSKESQGRFMDDRLGAALQQAGVSGPPKRAEWLEIAGHNTTEA